MYREQKFSGQSARSELEERFGVNVAEAIMSIIVVFAFYWHIFIEKLDKYVRWDFFFLVQIFSNYSVFSTESLIKQ